MPQPKSGETEREFLKRCIPETIHEGYEQKRAIAICFSKYRKSGTEAKSPKPERKKYSKYNYSKKDKIKLFLANY